MHDRSRAPAEGQEDFAVHKRIMVTMRDDQLEASAVTMHEASKSRMAHFNSHAMGDSAMDLLLSLFIARLHSRPVTPQMLSMANRIEPQKCDALLSELAHAGLVCNPGKPGHVQLTEGADRQIRAYLQQR